MNAIRSICVYCGSSPGRDAVYLKAGHTLGRSIAEARLRLVYGGGTKGIMGAVSDGALRAGGEVTGIIPRFLLNKEATEPALDRRGHRPGGGTAPAGALRTGCRRRPGRSGPRA